jgi:hypothetical protein
MEVIEPELLTRSPDIMDTASEALGLALGLFSRLDGTVFAISVDVVGQGDGHVEFVWVWVRVESFPKTLDGTRTEFVVLL